MGYLVRKRHGSGHEDTLLDHADHSKEPQTLIKDYM